MLLKRFDTILSIHLGHKIFSVTDRVSRTLQAPKITAQVAIQQIEHLKQQLIELRNEESFQEIYDAAVESGKSIDVEQSKLKRRKTQVNKKYDSNSNAH